MSKVGDAGVYAITISLQDDSPSPKTMEEDITITVLKKVVEEP